MKSVAMWRDAWRQRRKAEPFQGMPAAAHRRSASLTWDWSLSMRTRTVSKNTSMAIASSWYVPCSMTVRASMTQTFRLLVRLDMHL